MSLLRHEWSCSSAWHESCGCVVMPLTTRLSNLIWNHVVFPFFGWLHEDEPTAEELRRRRIEDQERAITQYLMDNRKREVE